MKGKNVLLFGILILLILGSGCVRGPSDYDLRKESIRDLLNTEAYNHESIMKLGVHTYYPKAVIYNVTWIENYTIQNGIVVATTETAFFIEYP